MSCNEGDYSTKMNFEDRVLNRQGDHSARVVSDRDMGARSALRSMGGSLAEMHQTFECGGGVRLASGYETRPVPARADIS